jgi:predicted transcriptional regulator
METHELLFELSHPTRYEILKLLVESPLRLTKIGEQVDANNPEVSRHLDRLKNAKIVAKNVDGYYTATTFGEVIFGLMPSISFVAAHPEFFIEHDLSLLPSGFLSRLGELSVCEVVEGFTINFYRLDEMSKKTRERIYTVSKESVTEISEENFAEFKNILADDFFLRFMFPVSQLEDENLMNFVEKSPDPDRYFRVIPEAPLFLTICDDEAMIAFLDKKGKTDFSVSFYSKDPSVIRWCEDLLNTLYEMGKPPSEYL